MKIIENLTNAVKNWWILLIIGILCVGCGIAVFATPAAGVATLAVILTVNLILVGILGIAFVISNRESIPAWGWNLVLPVLTVIAGIILACNPAASMIFIVCFFAAGVMCKSIETICYAIALSKIEGSGWGWTLAAGIIGLLLSIFLFMNPLFTGLSVGIFVGIALLVMGICAIATSIQLSKIKSAVKNAEKSVEEAAEQIQKTVEGMKER